MFENNLKRILNAFHTCPALDHELPTSHRSTPLNDILGQAGCSIIEMLGVLAIIGVLSVGGIAGYSKAMFKYKLNKQAEQINTLINATNRYIGKFGTSSVYKLLDALNEIPPEMKHSGIKDALNVDIYWSCDGRIPQRSDYY